MAKLVKTEFIRTSLPPTERSFPFQLLSFFWNLSSITIQSLLGSFLWCIGMPRYLNGVHSDLHPKSIAYSASNSFCGNWFLGPDNCSKVLNTSLRFLACSRSCSMKRMVSSGYCKTDKPRATPDTWPSSLALFIRIVTYVSGPGISTGSERERKLTNWNRAYPKAQSLLQQSLWN